MLIKSKAISNKMDRKIETRSDLAGYLNGIDIHNSEELASSVDEIIWHVRNVMKDILKREEKDPLRVYYEPQVKALEEAYKERSIKRIALAVTGLSAFLNNEKNAKT